MNTTILSSLLWLPFLLAALISGIIFSVNGYKRGLWRALISLGAVLVAALLSMGIAKLLALLITPAIMERLPDLGLADAGLPEGFALTLIKGLLQTALSLLLFVPLMLHLTIALRTMSEQIKRDRLITRDVPRRLGGMGVGMVSALLFALLLTLPFYGSLAAYVPVAEKVVSLQTASEAEDAPPQIYLQAHRQREEETVSDYLRCIAAHPIVRVSGSGPAAAMYRTLSSFSVNDAPVSYASMADTLDAVVAKLEEIVAADEAARPARCQELLLLLREEVAEQEWAYALAMDAVAQLQAAVPEDLDAFDAALYTELFQILDMSQEVFEQNCINLLDFASYAIEHDFLAIAETGDFQRLYSSGILEEAGRLFNSSPQTVAIKKLLLMGNIAPAFENDLQLYSDFVTAYPLDAITDPALQAREAEALLLGMGFGDASPAEILMRHPAFGRTAVEEAIALTDFASIVDYPAEYREAMVQFFAAHPEAEAAFLARLEECAAAPLGSRSFYDYAITVMQLEVLAREGNFYFSYDYDADTLEFALDVLGPETFASGALSAGAAFHTFFAQYPALMRSNEALFTTGYTDYMDGVTWMAKLMSGVKDGDIPADGDTPEWLQYSLSSIAASDACNAVIAQMVTAGGSDPSGIGAALSTAQADWLCLRIDEAYSNQLDYVLREDGSIEVQAGDNTDAAQYLKQFLGLQ